MKGEIKRVKDEEKILEIINSSAKMYEGAIPEDRYQEPYMSAQELGEEMRKMEFYEYRENKLVAVVGIQDLDEVTLIRHLYVRPERQRQGIGTKLLEFAIREAGNEEILVGTWKDAEWAIDFYRKNGFELMENPQKLLCEHWNIPKRQVEESMVLARGKRKF